MTEKVEKRKGRPPLGDKKKTPQELMADYRGRLREKGHREILVALPTGMIEDLDRRKKLQKTSRAKLIEMLLENMLLALSDQEDSE